jgi:copper ion binding protein
MEETKIKVKGMMCQHCVMHVTEGLKGIKGVKKVAVDLAKGEATIESKQPLTDDELKGAIEEAGYEFAGRI